MVAALVDDDHRVGDGVENGLEMRLAGDRGLFAGRLRIRVRRKRSPNQAMPMPSAANVTARARSAPNEGESTFSSVAYSPVSGEMQHQSDQHREDARTPPADNPREQDWRNEEQIERMTAQFRREQRAEADHQHHERKGDPVGDLGAARDAPAMRPRIKGAFARRRCQLGHG